MDQNTFCWWNHFSASAGSRKEGWIALSPSTIRLRSSSYSGTGRSLSYGGTGRSSSGGGARAPSAITKKKGQPPPFSCRKPSQKGTLVFLHETSGAMKERGPT